MSFIFKKLKEAKPTQVISKGLILNEVIKDDVLKELKKKFLNIGDVMTTHIRFHVIPKELPAKIEMKKGKEMVITTKPVDFITLDHPSPDHIRDKVVVVTSNRNMVLDKFLER